MERSSVSYGTYEAVVFGGLSVTQVAKFMVSLFSNHSVAGRLRVMWMIIAASFVVAFSTLSSAMSGYTANVEPAVTINQVTIPLDDVKPVSYTIRDFWRVNMTTPFVTAPDTDFYGYIYSCMGDVYKVDSAGDYYFNLSNPDNLNWTYISDDCRPLIATTICKVYSIPR